MSLDELMEIVGLRHPALKIALAPASCRHAARTAALQYSGLWVPQREMND